MTDPDTTGRAGSMMGWITRLLGPRPCDHDWRRLAVGWFSYEANPGKYFVICTKCRARETREETPNG